MKTAHQADPHRTLIRAMIARAYWDSIGRVGTSSYKTDARRVEIMRDARAFFKDGRFEHWVECLGCDDAVNLKIHLKAKMT